MVKDCLPPSSPVQISWVGRQLKVCTLPVVGKGFQIADSFLTFHMTKAKTNAAWRTLVAHTFLAIIGECKLLHIRTINSHQLSQKHVFGPWEETRVHESPHLHGDMPTPHQKGCDQFELLNQPTSYC